MELLQERGPLGPVYRLGPSGTTFSQPVQIRIPWDSSSLHFSAHDRVTMVTRQHPAEPWRPATTLRISGGFLVGETTHFSDFSTEVGWPAIAEGPSPEVAHRDVVARFQAAGYHLRLLALSYLVVVEIDGPGETPTAPLELVGLPPGSSWFSAADEVVSADANGHLVVALQGPAPWHVALRQGHGTIDIGAMDQEACGRICLLGGAHCAVLSGDTCAFEPAAPLDGVIADNLRVTVASDVAGSVPFKLDCGGRRFVRPAGNLEPSGIYIGSHAARTEIHSCGVAGFPVGVLSLASNTVVTGARITLPQEESIGIVLINPVSGKPSLLGLGAPSPTLADNVIWATLVGIAAGGMEWPEQGFGFAAPDSTLLISNNTVEGVTVAHPAGGARGLVGIGIAIGPTRVRVFPGPPSELQYRPEVSFNTVRGQVDPASGNALSFVGFDLGDIGAPILRNNNVYRATPPLRFTQNAPATPEICHNNLIPLEWRGVGVTAFTRVEDASGARLEPSQFSTDLACSGEGGNYWGRDQHPLFLAGETSNAPGVVDPSPFCRESAWAHGIAPEDCPPFGVPDPPEQNNPPVARLAAVPMGAVVGQQVVLDAAASTDDAPTTELLYRFDDGSGEIVRLTTSNTSVVATYSAPGTYHARVEVVDRWLATDTATAEVCVAAPSSLPRVELVGTSMATLTTDVPACSTNGLVVAGQFPPNSQLSVDGVPVVATWSHGPRPCPTAPLCPVNDYLSTADVPLAMVPGAHRVTVSTPEACSVPVQRTFEVAAAGPPWTRGLSRTVVNAHEDNALVGFGGPFVGYTEVRFVDIDVSPAVPWAAFGASAQPCGAALSVTVPAGTLVAGRTYVVEFCDVPMGLAPGLCTNGPDALSLPRLTAVDARDTHAALDWRGRGESVLVGEADDEVGTHVTVLGGPFFPRETLWQNGVPTGTVQTRVRFGGVERNVEWVGWDRINVLVDPATEFQQAQDILVEVDNADVGGPTLTAHLHVRCLGTLRDAPPQCVVAGHAPSADPGSCGSNEFLAYDSAGAPTEPAQFPAELDDGTVPPWLVFDQQADGRTHINMRFFMADVQSTCEVTMRDVHGGCIPWNQRRSGGRVLYFGPDDRDGAEYHWTHPLDYQFAFVGPPGSLLTYEVRCRVPVTLDTGEDVMRLFHLQPPTVIRLPPATDARVRLASFNDVYQESDSERVGCQGPPLFAPTRSQELSRATIRAVAAKLGALLRKGKVEMALVPGDISNDSGWYYDYLHSVMPLFNNICGAVPCYGIQGNHDVETVFDRYATSGRLCCAKNRPCAQTPGNQWPCADAFNVVSRPACNPADFGQWPLMLHYGPSTRPLFETVPLLSHNVDYDVQSQAISDRRPSSLLAGNTLKQHSYYAFRWGGVGFAVMDMPDTVWGRYKCENRDPTLNNGCAPGDAEPLGAMGWGAHTRAPDVESAQARFLRDADAWLPRDVRILVTHGYISGAEAWDTPSGQPYRDSKYLALDANALGFDISLAGHGDEGVGYEWLTEIGEPEPLIADENNGIGWIMPFTSASFVARERNGNPPGYATHRVAPGAVVSSQWKAFAQPTTTAGYCSEGFFCAQCLIALRADTPNPLRRYHSAQRSDQDGCMAADSVCLAGTREPCP